MISYHKVAFWGTSYKLFVGNRGEAKENCKLLVECTASICLQTDFVRAQFADKEDLVEFHQQSNVDKHLWCSASWQAKYWRMRTLAYVISPPWRGGAARHAHIFDGIFFPISDLRRNFCPPSNTSETIFSPIPTGRYVCLCTCVYRKCVPVPSFEFWSIYFAAFATNFCPLEILFAVLFDFPFSK